MKNNLLVLIISTFVSSFAFAGQWFCEGGLDGKQIVRLKIQGDERAQFAPEAKVAVMGMAESSLSVIQDHPESPEVARAIIGSEDPRSKMRLRLLPNELAPLKFQAYILLVNFAIKQELDAYCQYSN